MTLHSHINQSPYVLVGDPASKENFVEDIIQRESIPSYNIFRYNEELKIQEVRWIKKNLSTGAILGMKRLFLVRDATIAAQNALLKTLEELPEDTVFIFFNDSKLIPTILSRSRIISFERDKTVGSNDLLIMLRRFINEVLSGDEAKRDPASIMLFSDRLFAKYPDLNFSEIVLILRTVLLEKLQEHDSSGALVVFKILKELNQNMLPVEVNNLNKRLLLEKILITKA